VEGGDENRCKMNSGKVFDALEWLANLCSHIPTIYIKIGITSGIE
jgi:hypothetical protein